jgi:FAD synthetase
MPATVPTSSCHYQLTLRGFAKVNLGDSASADHRAFPLFSRASDVERSESVKQANQGKTVLASGVFDLLHLGHVRFLEEAKKTGGPNAKLTVVVARDKTVEKKKGKKPIVSENQRCALVGSLKVVDEAMLGYDSLDMGKVLEKIKPDIVALGYDSHKSGLEKAVQEAIEKKGLKIRMVRVGKFSSDELDSSSKIKKKIVEQFQR